MQSAQEFIQEFFRARTADIQQELAGRAAFRRKFFAEGCGWDSRAGDVELNETETIESVFESGPEVRVFTRHRSPIPRLCYQLKRTPGGWLIDDVACECLRCRGQAGHTDCFYCAGTGWFGAAESRASLARLGMPIPDAPA